MTDYMQDGRRPLSAPPWHLLPGSAGREKGASVSQSRRGSAAVMHRH